MTDNPCTHCGGSGREPDPVRDAWQAWDAVLGDLPMGAGARLARAASAYRDACQARAEKQDARMVFLEAALRDILQRFPPTETGAATTTQPRPSTWHDVRNWRAILGDDGTPHRHWSFWDTDHIGALTCSCGTRWRPGSGPIPEPTCAGGC